MPRNMYHPEEIRAKISTSLLLKRLNDNALGKETMTPTQVRCAEVLLKKVLPDLKAVEVTGADGGAVQFNVTITPHGV